MNVRPLIAAALATAALSTAGTAFAFGEATYELPQPVVSQTSRAAVLAELASARTAGTAVIGEADWPALPAVASVLTRAEVRAEARAAQTDPAWREIQGESHSFALAVTPVAPTRVATAR